MKSDLAKNWRLWIVLLILAALGGNPSINSKMPAFSNQLSREQIIAVLEFIKQAWGHDEREYQWWMTAVGANRE